MKPIKIFNDVGRFTIDWTLNTLCTYKCSYCPPCLNSGSNIIFKKEDDSRIVKTFLTNLQKRVTGRSIHIFLNGGEPTISPSFETIADFCNDAGWCLYVNTNASRSIEWWREYAPKLYKVSVSYHPEYDNGEIFEKVIEIGKLTNVGVFTLMYPPYWDRAVKAFEIFKTYPNITLEPSRVFKRETSEIDVSYEYTEEQLNWLKNNSGLGIRGGIKAPLESNPWGNTFVEYNNGSVEKLDEVEFVNNSKNSFKGWSCNMGVDHIFIRGDKISHSACGQAKPFSTIKNFNDLVSSPSICNIEWCMCTADVMIPKFK